MKQTLRINGMPMNLNKYRNAHYHTLNKEKQIWELVVRNECHLQGIKPMQEVDITVHFYFKDKRRHDADNYACCCKFIFDGLVKASVIPDDSFDYIRSLKVVHGGYDKQPYILVEMEGE